MTGRDATLQGPALRGGRRARDRSRSRSPNRSQTPAHYRSRDSLRGTLNLTEEDDQDDDDDDDDGGQQSALPRGTRRPSRTAIDQTDPGPIQRADVGPRRRPAIARVDMNSLPRPLVSSTPVPSVQLSQPGWRNRKRALNDDPTMWWNQPGMQRTAPPSTHVSVCWARNRCPSLDKVEFWVCRRAVYRVMAVDTWVRLVPRLCEGSQSVQSPSGRLSMFSLLHQEERWCVLSERRL